MSLVLHPIEKKIINALRKHHHLSTDELIEQTDLSIDQVRRGIEWLKLKELAIINEDEKIFVSLGKNGLTSLKNGLPERRLVLSILDTPTSFDDAKKSFEPSEFSAAIANARKNNWIAIEKTNNTTLLVAKSNPELNSLEKLIAEISDKKILTSQILDKNSLSVLKKRPDFISESSIKTQSISLTPKTSDIQINADTTSIDVEADVPRVFAARTHPLKDTIDEIREIFVNLGFSEIRGNMSQSSFWNFDALFTPQDHPAREMQDTFYLKDSVSKKPTTENQIKKVSSSHKKNWRYDWQKSESQKMVLRTHTTCVTIKYLAEQKPDESRVFSLGRVFRNEKVSYKHLVEFNQIEGIVIGKNTTLRDLMGLQKEFYKKIGLNKIKFWPTFFPYTEPSLQTMVYNERLGKWVEMFGMGIFRPEVTKPLGITKPVLAWGGGIERIAMMKYGLDDVREFYNNDLGWLRGVTKCQ